MLRVDLLILAISLSLVGPGDHTGELVHIFVAFAQLPEELVLFLVVITGARD